MTRYVAYYRVSTDKQGRSGLGLEAQRRSVAELSTRLGADVVAEYTEIESGRRDDRPQLDLAIAHSKRARAVLVVAKLDRLSRRVSFVSRLMDSGVDFIAADMPEANRLTIHILAAVAEHEREMISQRTRAGLAASTKRLGNPRYADSIDRARSARSERAHAWAEGLRPVVEGLRRSGCHSQRSLAHGLESAGIKTRTGSSSWSSTQVGRLLARIGA